MLPLDSTAFTVVLERESRRKVPNQQSSIQTAASQDQASLQKGTKVAPGMELKFLVTFHPQTKEDYSCDLTFVTEREIFVVPVRAFGSRGSFVFSTPLLIIQLLLIFRIELYLVEFQSDI